MTESAGPHPGKLESMQIALEPEAARFILDRGGAVVLGLEFEPSVGGCACSPSRLSGSYLPVIATGRPAADEAGRYQMQVVAEVEVYFPPNLNLKQGSGELRISLRGFLGFHWLELAGAKGIACLVG
jgi:hypothetical protein